jgi:hypothetical protein
VKEKAEHGNGQVEGYFFNAVQGVSLDPGYREELEGLLNWPVQPVIDSKEKWLPANYLEADDVVPLQWT